ncbi:MAG: glycosyltransferase family 2 protein [Caldilineaceae bacterium]|nr:glycosyltransferase family 2 protein [Caldilineaceae bacterium]
MDPLEQGKNSPTLAVIILNWNAAADTLACLAHVAAWQSVTPRVWVVDNGSQPADRKLLREGLAHLPLAWSLIENESNLGFAGGTNCGLRAALAEGDWPILLLNNDASIDDAGLQQLMATLESHANVGWVGPLLYHGDKLHSVGRRNPVLHHNTLITELPAAPILPVDFISGSVALVRAALLREVGLLDEDYFFNTEVADHCHRSREAGYLTVVDCRARAEHNLDRSSALRSTLHVYYIIRNRFVYVRKRYHTAKWPLTIVWAIYCLLLVGKLRLSGAGATAQAVYLGLVDGVSKRWGGQNCRVLAACGQDRSQDASPDKLPDRLPGASQTGQ